MKSDWLRIRVTESDRETVDLSYGAAAASDLNLMLPVNVRQMLLEARADLEGAGEQARLSGFEPGRLVQTDNGTARVEIWLE